MKEEREREREREKRRGRERGEERDRRGRRERREERRERRGGWREEGEGCDDETNATTTTHTRRPYLPSFSFIFYSNSFILHSH